MAATYPGVSLEEFEEAIDEVNDSIEALSTGHTGNVRAYGDSKLESSESYVGTGRLQDRFGSKVSGALAAYLRNYGVGGTQATTEGPTQVWPLRNAHTFDGSYPTTPEDSFRQLRAGFHLFDAGFNDGWKKSDGTDGPLWATYKHTMRALIHQSRAQFAWQADSPRFTLTGWTQNALNANYGSKYALTSTNRSIVWTSGTSNGVGGTLVFYFIVFDKAPAGRRFRARARIGADPTVVATLDAATDGLGISGFQSICALTVPNVPTGNVSVTVDIDTITGDCRFLGATLVPTDAENPLVCLVEQPQTPNMPWMGDANLYWTTAAHNACNLKLRELATEFGPGVFTVDVDSVSSQQRYVKDDVHLNNRGESEKTKLVLQAIAEAGGVQPSFSAAYPVVSGAPTHSMHPGQVAFDPTTHILYVAEGALGRTYRSVTFT
jgi:hypothetical protein